MFIKFIFKNLNISYSKIKPYIIKINNLSFNNSIIYLNYLNNKSSLILRKVLNSVLFNIKKNYFNNLFYFYISFNKGLCFKKLFFRSKGRLNFKKKCYSNIIFYLNIF